MIFAYLIMVSMITLSIFYLYRSVSQHLNQSFDSGEVQDFLNIRRTEINEEQEAGRLTSNESLQLLLDVDDEANSLSLNSKHSSLLCRRFNMEFDIHLARWVMLGVIVVTVLGSVSLYYKIGYSTEVSFTQDLQRQKLTPQKVSEFLHYRSQRYDRVEDWYYEATDSLRAGKYQDAVVAFETAISKIPDGAENRVSLLVEYAQAIFYANGNQSSEKMLRVVNDILRDSPTQAIALGLKGVAEFDHKNYLGAVLAWQEAIRYNPNSTERIALLSAINKARDAGGIDYKKVAPIITHQLAIQIEWDTNNIQWQSNDLLLVYALAKGEKMPVAIQRVHSEDVKEPILLTNLDALMPTMTLAEIERVDLVVKLSNINDNDLTKGQIIGIKEGLFVNSKEIIGIKVAL
jgi:cytochrome c-type biogenesis protein CcmH